MSRNEVDHAVESALVASVNTPGILQRPDSVLDTECNPTEIWKVGSTLFTSEDCLVILFLDSFAKINKLRALFMLS